MTRKSYVWIMVCDKHVKLIDRDLDYRDVYVGTCYVNGCFNNAIIGGCAKVVGK